jgi:hypothetical protein
MERRKAESSGQKTESEWAFARKFNLYLSAYSLLLFAFRPGAYCYDVFDE